MNKFRKDEEFFVLTISFFLPKQGEVRGTGIKQVCHLQKLLQGPGALVMLPYLKSLPFGL